MEFTINKKTLRDRMLEIEDDAILYLGNFDTIMNRSNNAYQFSTEKSDRPCNIEILDMTDIFENFSTIEEFKLNNLYLVSLCRFIDYLDKNIDVEKLHESQLLNVINFSKVIYDITAEKTSSVYDIKFTRLQQTYDNNYTDSIKEISFDSSSGSPPDDLESLSNTFKEYKNNCDAFLKECASFYDIVLPLFKRNAEYTHSMGYYITNKVLNNNWLYIKHFMKNDNSDLYKYLFMQYVNIIDSVVDTRRSGTSTVTLMLREMDKIFKKALKKDDIKDYCFRKFLKKSVYYMMKNEKKIKKMHFRLFKNERTFI